MLLDRAIDYNTYNINPLVQTNIILSIANSTYLIYFSQIAAKARETVCEQGKIIVDT